MTLYGLYPRLIHRYFVSFTLLPTCEVASHRGLLRSPGLCFHSDQGFVRFQEESHMTLLSPVHETEPFEELLCGASTLVEPGWACLLFHTVKPQHTPPLGLHIGIIPRQP